MHRQLDEGNFLLSLFCSDHWFLLFNHHNHNQASASCSQLSEQVREGQEEIVGRDQQIHLLKASAIKEAGVMEQMEGRMAQTEAELCTMQTRCESQESLIAQLQAQAVSLEAQYDLAVEEAHGHLCKIDGLQQQVSFSCWWSRQKTPAIDSWQRMQIFS